MSGEHKDKKTTPTDARTNALVLAFVFVVVAMLGSSAYEAFWPSEGASLQEEETVSESYEHPLTGRPVEVPFESFPRVFGVMIDNHPDARPQSGLDEAFLVFEAPVEGSTTRFLALFSEDQELPAIGPVRSARPYFLNWSEAFDAAYVHVGGSPEALEEIQGRGVIDIDEYAFGGTTFTRERSRFAPHNVYTSMEQLRDWMDDHGADVGDPTYGVWTFASDWLDETGTAETVTVPFIGSSRAQWRLDDERGAYKRFQSGSFRAHRGEGEIFADNVIVMEFDGEVIDDVGRWFIDTNASGPALVFQNGHDIEGYWEKNATSQRVRFYTEDDEEISMLPGNTWIEVVPDSSRVDWE